jgi:uncharacterized protein
MPNTAYVAFDGDRRIGSGSLRDVARAAKTTLERRKDASVLVFDSSTSALVDLDLRGSIDDVLKRLPQQDASPPSEQEAEQPSARGPGRPKLGVVAREVTLLPRHWDWLAKQKGGASVAIRKLVEEARRAGEERDRIRLAQEAAFRFMSAMAGNRPHYEEAIRALFAADAPRFAKMMEKWPSDISSHALLLAGPAFRRGGQDGAEGSAASAVTS